MIFLRDLPDEHCIIESIDSSFRYLKWEWETKNILEMRELFPQEASYLEEEIGLMATIVKKSVFIATSLGFVREFSLKSDKQTGNIVVYGCIFSIINIKKAEMPVALDSIKIRDETYILLVKKTTATLYKPLRIKRKVELQIICAISLNSSITREGIVKGNKLLYSVFYTAAYMLSIDDDECLENEYIMSGALSSKADNTSLEATRNLDKFEKPAKPHREYDDDYAEEDKQSLKNENDNEKSQQEENKGSLLNVNTTNAKDTTIEHSFSLAASKKKIMKKPAIMVYLADSKAYLHAYKVTDLDYYSIPEKK